MRAKTMRAKSRKAAGQCDGQFEPPYGCAGAMSGLHERAMDRQGETRSAVRCWHGLPDLRHRPGERMSALPEGGTGG